MTSESFQLFTDRLSDRLREPLPGRFAQEMMAPRPIDESRFKENPKQPARPGGVMVLLYPKDGDIYLPLMKRPVYEGAHSGQVSFPGGKVEKEDKDLIDTALRETREEIGVLPNDIQVLGQLSELFIIASNFKVFPTVGVLKNEPDFIPDEREVDRVLLPNLSHLKNLSNRGMKTMKFPPYTISSPYFDVEGEVVWGATAMILSELIHIVEDLGV